MSTSLVENQFLRLVEIMDEGTSLPEFSKVFYAPNMIFINKDKLHRLISLEDDTVCSCIHAVKTTDGELVDPNFLIETLWSTNNGELFKKVKETYEKDMIPFMYQEVK